MPWVAVDIGFFPGGTFSQALAATPNDDLFIVVGQGDTNLGDLNGHAFWWTEDTGLIDLGLLPGGTISTARAVSADGGTVVGDADNSDGFLVPVVWKVNIPDGAVLSMTPIPLLSDGQQGQGRAVSFDSSTIGGFSDIDPYPTNNVNPFLWISGPSSTDLGLQTPNTQGAVTGFSEDGLRAVGSPLNSTNGIPWTWSSGGGLAAMPLATDEVTGTAQACSVDGLKATGASFSIARPRQQAFLFIDGSGTDLIGLAGGADFSIGWGMSADGTVIVGDSAPTGQHEGFYWTQLGGFEDLPPLGGGSSSVARGISAGGDIPVGECRVIGGATTAVYWLFATTPLGPFVTVAELFMTTTTAFVDMTVESNRRKFISATGGARNLGPAGGSPFGVSAIVFLTDTGSPDSFTDNSGRGGPFPVSSGTVDVGSSNPPGSLASSQTFTPPSPGQGVLGDYRNGNLYAFNSETNTDNGTPRKWIRRWRAMAQSTSAPIKFNWLNIDAQTGIGVPDGTNPQLVLRWSDDGGHTWSDERILDAGRLGETTQQIKFNRLGMTRRFSGSDRIFELSSTSPFRIAIMDADVEIG